MIRKLIFACLLLVGTVCAQTNYYVDIATGDDTRSAATAQNPATPWKTIGNADGKMTISAGGVIVHVKAGAYTAGLTCAGTGYNSVVCVNQGGTSATARIRYQCDTPASLAMLGTNQGCLLLATGSFHVAISGAGYPGGANFVDIVGFHFAPDPVAFALIGTSCAQGLPAGTQCPNVNSWHIYGNLTEPAGSANACDINHAGAAIEMAGRHGNWATDLQVIGNWIGPDGDPNGSCQYGYAVYANGQNQTIQNNIMWQSRIGVHVFDGACNTVVSNNVIINMVELGILAWNHNIYGDCSQGTLKGLNTFNNNVIVNTGVGWPHVQFNEGAGIQASQECTSTRPTLISNNLMFGNVTGNFLGYNGTAFDPCAATPNTKAEDPTTTFVNFANSATASSDFHLKAGSQAIGGGTSTCVAGAPYPSCVPPTDIAGTVRPASGPQDIGAYVKSSAGVPIVTFSPSPLNFGTVAVSTSVTLTTTLTNSGGANLTFSPATIAGPNAGDFAIVIPVPTSPIVPGSSGIYTVKFTPQATGSRTATLTLNDNAAGSPHQVPLTGSGGVPGITLTPASQDFGVFAPTTPVTCTATQTTVLTSSGSSPLTITAPFSNTGANPGDFTSSGSCNLSPMSPGTSCNINLKFCPTASGARSATLVIQDTAAGSPHFLPLTGSGGTSTATLLPASFGYGSVQVGTSVAHTFVYTNIGTLTLTGITVSLTGATTSYVQTNNCPPTLSPGANCNIVAVFKPGSTGVLSATLSVSSSATVSPTTSGLSGTGTAPSIILSSSAVNFGNVLLGATGNSSITVTNNGTAAAAISGVLTALPFSQTNNCPASLAVNASCTITLHVMPTVLGLATGTVSVSDNAPGNPHVASLSVTGVAPTGSLAPSSHDFGSQPNGSQSSPFNFTWANTGTGPMTWTVSITGTNSGDFILTANSCPNPLPAGQACLIPVSFKPAGVGARGPANLSLANSSSVTPITSTLTGTGTSVAPAVCLSVTNVNFGNAPVNSTSNAIPIVATNCGTAALTSVVVTPTGNFSQTNDFSVSIAVGAHFTIQGKFAPLSAGVLSGNFSIASNAASSPDIVLLQGFGTQAGANLTSAAAFDHVTVGNISSIPLTLLNTGNVSLALGTGAITGTGASQFSFGSGCPSSLPVNGSCSITITFAPLAAQAFSATFTQPFTDGTTSVTSALSGTGDAPLPTVSLTPTSIQFGDVQQGTPSAAKTIQLQNTSTTTLTLTSVLPTGANAADVGITSHCGATPIVIAVGNRCTVDVTMTPSIVGDENAAVTFTTNAASSPDSVSLTIRGTAVPVPRALLAPTSLSFSPPSIQTGTTSAAQSVVLNNIGNANLLVSGVALTGVNAVDFTQTNNCGTVTAGGNCSAQVNCAPPSDTGSLTANLVFTDNDSTVTQTAALTCTSFAGTPIITLGISAIDFNNQTVGTTSAPLVFIVTNTGMATASGLTITASPDFNVSGACGATLAAGANCPEQVTFSPAVLCGQTDPNNSQICISNVHLGQVIVISNTSASPQTIALKGTAIPVPPPPGPVRVTMGGAMVLGGHLVVGVQ